MPKATPKQRDLKGLTNADIDKALEFDTDTVRCMVSVSKAILSPAPFSTYQCCGVTFTEVFTVIDPRTKRKENRYADVVEIPKLRFEEIKRRLENSFVEVRYRINRKDGVVYEDDWHTGATALCYDNEAKAKFYRDNPEIVDKTIGTIGRWYPLSDFFVIEETEAGTIESSLIAKTDDERLRKRLRDAERELARIKKEAAK